MNIRICNCNNSNNVFGIKQNPVLGLCAFELLPWTSLSSLFSLFFALLCSGARRKGSPLSPLV